MRNPIFGEANSFNTTQYVGELFTADSGRTPLLSMTGGTTGGLRTDNEEFPTAVLFNYPDARQPSISEDDAAWGPSITHIAKEQETNVTQIFHEAVGVTYQRLSNTGRLGGVTTLMSENAADNELDFQIAHKLKVMARDIEFTFINGQYSKRGDVFSANQSRGLIAACGNVNVINADGDALAKSQLSDLFRQMADNGAYFDDMVIFVNSRQKAAISEIYSNQPGFMLPQSREKAGVNVLEIDNDFFKCGVVYSKFVPQDVVLIADIAHIAPVFQTVPGKGHLFLEELAKVGASDRYQLYAQVGLAHGPAFLHGLIRGLEV
ncbi:MAG: DUF5309 domain-containing protein [Defluviitaleaceae bacterium]|nr:DUF5309 domain-containing protein [Defluviitaleaceae bacterium]